MKIREWEIREHLTSLIGEPDAFGSSRDFVLYVWRPRVGFAIYQRGKNIAIAIDGLSGNYFEPDLEKINGFSLDRANAIAGGSRYDYGADYVSLDEIEKLFC